MKIVHKPTAALILGIAIGATVGSQLNAQTKTPAAYWVTETLEMTDQAAFMKAIPAVFPTVQKHGGKYIVLGGKIVADHGPEPKRITIIAFDSLEKAQAWLQDTDSVKTRTEALKYAKTRSYIVEGNPNQ